MSSPVRGAYVPPASYSLDEMFGYVEDLERPEPSEPDIEQQATDEIWGAYWKAVESGSYLKLYQMAEKYRFTLSEPFSFEEILDRNLQAATKEEHFDALRKLAIAEQMFNPESLLARVIQALTYHMFGNRVSALSILKSTNDEESNREIGKQIGWMIVKYRENRPLVQHLLDLMAFYSKGLGKV